MFEPCKETPEMDFGGLVALHFSLNHPVLAIPELPAGPASAAIAACEHGGTRRIVVAIRSLTGGARACYLREEPLGGAPPLRVSVDAALSFAESMGFLFDENVAEKARRSDEALRRWRRLVGLDPPSLATQSQVDGVGPKGASEPARPRKASPSPAPVDPTARRPRLSRFRVRDGEGPARATDGTRALASRRVPVARVRLAQRKARAAQPAPGPLLRFLALF